MPLRQPLLWIGATALALGSAGWIARPASRQQPRPAATAPAPRATGVPAAAFEARRIDALSRKYMGTPYLLDCLGEEKGPDADPLFTREQVDCQTLVEQVMAEAIAPWSGGLDAAVRKVRYHGSEISLENRYHYCIPDWLENPWPARDVTAEIAPSKVRPTTRRIDRPAFLAGRGASAAESPVPAETVRTAYIPRSEVASITGRIPDGSIGIFVLDRNDIVSGHVGFLFRRGETVTFRHASQTRKQVIEEPLLQYLGRAPRRFIGMMVLQPDAAGLRRPDR